MASSYEIKIRNILRNSFGLDSLTITKLVGERDLNFFIQCTNSSKYIFKIHPLSDRDFIAAQQRLLLHINEKDIPEPNIISAIDGATVIAFTNNTICRLLSWVDGAILSELEPNSDLLTQAGRAVAQLDYSLSTFDYLEIKEILNRPFGWNVLQTDQLIPRVDMIPNTALRELVCGVLENLVSRTFPVLNNLPRQVKNICVESLSVPKFYLFFINLMGDILIALL